MAPTEESKSMDAKDAITEINEMSDFDTIKAFVDGDTRKTVNDAATARLNQLMSPVNKKLSLNDTRDELHKQKHYKITIASGERPETKADVTVSCNGFNYRIQRDREVIVPESIIGILKDAKVKQYDQVRRSDGQDGYRLVEREGLRFPYTLIGEAERPAPAGART